MEVSLVAAVGENGVIGLEGGLPWNIPADLKRFRELTMGKPVIMGRKTYDSIGKALSGRTNIIITRNQEFEAADCIVVHSISEALQAAGRQPEIMIIGGAGIYRQFLPLATRVYLTEIDAVFEGDVFFPSLDNRLWNEISREIVNQSVDQPYSYHFVVYERAGSRITPGKNEPIEG